MQTVQALSMCSQFYELWMKSFESRFWSKTRNFTLLVPSDRAFADLSPDELKYLRSDEVCAIV